jgi:hypothetical protein
MVFMNILIGGRSVIVQANFTALEKVNIKCNHCADDGYGARYCN